MCRNRLCPLTSPSSYCALEDDPLGFQPAMIPKYSLMGPFRGHMSIKSSPAVDSSAPKSLNTSIKYRDRQKRDNLIKAIEKYKKQKVWLLSAPPVHSRNIFSDRHTLRSSLDLASSGRMPSLKERDKYFPKHSKKPHSRTQSRVLSAEETIQDIVWWPFSEALCNGKTTVHQHALPHSQSHRLGPSRSHSKKIFQPLYKKTFGGDLLDIHRQWFTETNQPFIPKVLKTPNKSFLSKYRYYNSPCRKKSSSSDIPSYKNPGKFHRALEDEYLRSYADYFLRHLLKKHNQTSVSLQALLQAKEEELKYLQFLKEITDDILIRSCYQNKTLGDVFQLHVRNRRYDLDEVKMQRIFQALKEDLNNCTGLQDPSISYCGLKHRRGRRIAPNM